MSKEEKMLEVILAKMELLSIENEILNLKLDKLMASVQDVVTSLNNQKAQLDAIANDIKNAPAAPVDQQIVDGVAANDASIATLRSLVPSTEQPQG